MEPRVVFLILLPALVVACAQSPNRPHERTGPEQASHVTTAGVDPTTSASGPQVAEVYRPDGDIEFKAVKDLRQQAGAAPQLRKGRVADSNEWPASLYVTFQTPRGRAACTAALIGPRAMLTAGHCVPTTGRVTFTYGNTTYQVQCEPHPEFVSRRDPSADYALCRLEGERRFAEPPGFKYETVDTADMEGLVGSTVILTGYGCVSDFVAERDTDGKYRIGFNSIDQTSASPAKRRGDALYAGREDNNLFTKDDPEAANLCPGDSGGPLFRRASGVSEQVTSRQIVGVNSRVFYRDATRTTYGSSLVSATGGPDFRSWAENWARTVARVDACGLNGAIPNCRS